MIPDPARRAARYAARHMIADLSAMDWDDMQQEAALALWRSR